MATWKQHIEVYTREIETDDLSEAQLSIIIADTLSEWVEKAPLDLLSKHASESVEIPNGGLLITDKKIIKVYREGKICSLKDFEDYHKFSDTTSLHYASNYTPVFYIETLGESEVSNDTTGPHVKIFPTLEGTEKAKGIFFNYPSTLPSGNEAGYQGLPPRMIQVVVMAVAEKILNHKLAMMVHEEEDTEISQIIQQQIGNIKALIASQAERLGLNQGEDIVPKSYAYVKGQQ